MVPNPDDLDRLLPWAAVLSQAGSLSCRERRFCAAVTARALRPGWRPTRWQVARLARIVRRFQIRLAVAIEGDTRMPGP